MRNHKDYKWLDFDPSNPKYYKQQDVRLDHLEEKTCDYDDSIDEKYLASLAIMFMILFYIIMVFVDFVESTNKMQENRIKSYQTTCVKEPSHPLCKTEGYLEWLRSQN